ncbi:unnamed protein product [Meganyctiphanes norvegica]|uniref:Uncharacterized protein n=1 Tax=Meganyctiphanes norvegica TaxID=48144 RepID=A0AAV2R3X0_MEGNR
MGFKRLSPVMRMKGRRWCSLDARTAALATALYSMLTSVLLIVVYSGRIVYNASHASLMLNLYYGIQIAYVSILCSHLVLIALSGFLILGVYKEQPSYITPWILGNIAFLALEGVCCVYSNVLRDHINKHFDLFCKAELLFLVTRIILSIPALWGVLKFCRNLHNGFSYQDPETVPL